MKHVFIILNLVLLLSNVVFSQDTFDDGKVGFIYSEIVIRPRLMSNKVNISIDFGQETSWLEDRRLRNEQTGKLETFNSIIDALNYMAQDGWEVHQVFVLPNESGNTCKYLLKKKIIWTEVKD